MTTKPAYSSHNEGGMIVVRYGNRAIGHVIKTEKGVRCALGTPAIRATPYFASETVEQAILKIQRQHTIMRENKIPLRGKL